MTNGVGADAVLECVGTRQSMQQAIQSARPGAMIGYVGVPHGVQLDGQVLFFSQTGMPRGPVTARPDRTRSGVVRTGASVAIWRGRHNVVFAASGVR